MHLHHLKETHSTCSTPLTILTRISSADTQHKEEKKEENKDKYIYRERSYGSYQRSFDISGIDAQRIAAEYKNGILYLDLPKKEAHQPETKRLEIK